MDEQEVILSQEGYDKLSEDMQKALLSNADSIMKNARTEDGYYDGSWQGPAGKTVWSTKGSLPQQITTSGSTTSMVTAAAILEAKIDGFSCLFH